VGGKLFFIFFIVFGLSMIGFAMGVMFQKMAEQVDGENEAKLWIFRASEGLLGKIGTAVLFDLLALIILTLVGAFFHMFVENMSAIDSFYWTVATYTTVGYGDLSHSGDVGTKWFLIFYILVAVALAAAFLGNFAHLFVKTNMDAKLKAVVEKGVTENMIKAMDVDGNGDVDRAEFLQFMLIKMGKVDVQSMRELNVMFDSVDLTKSGTLTMADVVAAQERRIK